MKNFWYVGIYFFTIDGDARKSIEKGKIISAPIEKLSLLGAGVSSLIPAFNTVTVGTRAEAKYSFFISISFLPGA